MVGGASPHGDPRGNMRHGSRIRILRIIARLNIGGPAIQAISLSSELPRARYRSLLVSGTISPHEGDMAYLARDRGVTPLVIPELGRKVSPLDDVRCLMGIRSIMKRFRPHIVHTHTAKAGTLGRLAAFTLNAARSPDRRIRLVHTFHGHVFHGYFNPLVTRGFTLIERALARVTDRIVVISPLQKKDICHTFGVAREEQVRVVPLGFDLAPFGGTCGRTGELLRRYFPDRPPETLMVGIIGRLTGVKNHRLLLDAVSRVRAAGYADRFRFLVVGDGELRGGLERRAAELDVGDMIAFCGWRRDMPSVFRGLDAVVLTSRNEGTPVALIEAMAAGRPVVSTDVGGVRDLLGNPVEDASGGVTVAERGILVPSEDGDALARALVFLADHHGLVPGLTLRGSEFVAARYSLDRLVRDMRLLYSEVLTQAGGRCP